MALLKVKNLSVRFESRRGPIVAVDKIGFQIEKGETLGIVGESGCGKSLTGLSLLGLLPPNASLCAEKLEFEGRDLLSLFEAERRKIRGGAIAMIFQDPMTSLNPCFSIGFQLDEALRTHTPLDVKKRRSRAIELLSRVGIAQAECRLSSYPHQLSGGMCQRVMIAMAIACYPKLLIADEPTTALDVTIQAQILFLLSSIQKEEGMAMILVSHDLGVIASHTENILVMYAGQIVESGKTKEVLTQPRHPYTAGLPKMPPRRQWPFIGTESVTDVIRAGPGSFAAA